MNRAPVQSSQIASIGHDDCENVLEVEFIRGGVYRYYGVPADVHAAFMAAESKGTFLGQKIKPGYRCKKATPEGWVDIVERPASAKSIDLLRVLAKKAGISDGTGQEYITPLWRHVVEAACQDFGAASGLMVETWLAGLNQSQCSAAIDMLKARTT